MVAKEGEPRVSEFSKERYRTPSGSQLNDFLGVASEFFGTGGSSRNKMKPYPLAEELLRPVLRVVMPRAHARDPRWTIQRAVGSAALVARYLPSRSRRILPAPPQFKPLEAER